MGKITTISQERTKKILKCTISLLEFRETAIKLASTYFKSLAGWLKGTLEAPRQK